MRNTTNQSTRKPDLRSGCTYSNGWFGDRWEVRRILRIDAPCDQKPEATIDYQIVVGPRRRKKGRCSCAEFSDWARYRVEQNESTWYRVDV